MALRTSLVQRGVIPVGFRLVQDEPAWGTTQLMNTGMTASEERVVKRVTRVQ